MSKAILHCVSSLHVGGAEKCAVNLATFQQSQGYEVKVLSYGAKNDPFQEIIESRNISVVNIAGSLLSRLRQAVSEFARYDLIHIHSPSVIRAFMPIFPFLLGRKVIYTHHGEDSPGQKGMRLSHWIAALYLNQDFAVSGKVKQSVKKRYNWNPSNTEIIQNGVIIPDIAIKVPVAPIKFGCVARLVPLKQIDKVVDAFSRATFPSACELHLFGDGPEKNNVENAIENHTLSKAVQMHGNVLDENAIYSHIDCLVINSTTEGLPMALLEAMARGIPVISTEVGEIPILNSKKEFARLIRDDTEELASAMALMAALPENWLTLANNGRALVAEDYAIATVSGRYLQELS